jgi:hypothetical protein
MRIARLLLSLLPELTVGALLFSVAWLFLFLPSPLSGDDALRHLAMARVLWDEGCCPGWDRFIYAGYLAEHRVDPWFLAHITYLPFIGFETALALKLYTLVSIAVLCIAFLSLVRSLGLKPLQMSFLLVVLLWGDALFFGRVLLARPFVLMTALVLVELQLILKRRLLAVAALIVAATLFSHLFVLPLGIAVAASGWMWSFGERNRAYQLLFVSLLAVAVGVLLHPHPWQYLHYLWFVFLRIPFSQSLPLGVELYSGFRMSLVPVATLGIAVLLLAAELQRDGFPALTKFHRQGGTMVFLLCTVLLFGLFLWARMIDLLWPLLIVLLAHVFIFCKPVLAEVQTVVCLQWRSMVLRGGALVCNMVLIYCIAVFSVKSTNIIRTDVLRSLESFAVLKLVPPGANVLNPEWDPFPSFAVSQPYARYATGMDPTFLFVQNAQGHDAIKLAYNSILTAKYPLIDVGALVAELRRQFPTSTHLILSQRRFGNILPRVALVPGVRQLSAPGTAYALFAFE